MKPVFVIWVLCVKLVLQQNTCAAVRYSLTSHTKGIFVQAHGHLGSQNYEAARDITIVTDQTEGKQKQKQFTKDNKKLYSSFHGGKYMEIEPRELIYHVDYQDPTTHPITPSDGSWTP